MSLARSFVCSSAWFERVSERCSNPLFHGLRRALPAFVLLPLLLSLPACSRPADAGVSPPAAKPASQSPAAPDGVVLELGDRFGSPESLRCEVGYKVKRKAGRLTKTLEVELDNDAPNAPCAVVLDGVTIGTMTTNEKGDAKLKLVEDQEQLFPKGMTEPKPGSAMRIGTRVQMQLKPLVRLTDLEASIAGPGQLHGKVTYQVEQLGQTVSREFQIKLTGGPPKASLPVTLDGAVVGELTIDVEGQGRLRFSTLKPPPFPAPFAEPGPGARIRIGELYAGELQGKATATSTSGTR